MILGIAASQKADAQPIGGEKSACLFHESRFLTSWITPESLEVVQEYEQLTQGIASLEDRIMVCLRYVSDIPYTEFVRVETRVGGKKFTQNDAWLEPAQAIVAGVKLNCVNRSFLLASLLGQELPPNDNWVCIGNLLKDGQRGHAWNVIKFGGVEYLLESTSLSLKARFIPITNDLLYEDIVYLNSSEVRGIPGKIPPETFSACYHCIPFLQDYTNPDLCI